MQYLSYISFTSSFSVNIDSPQSQETSKHLESNTNNSTAITPVPTESQRSTISINSTQLSTESPQGPDGKPEAVKPTKSEDGSKQSHASRYATVIIPQVQVQLNGSALSGDSAISTNSSANTTSSSSNTSPKSPTGSPDLQCSPQHSTFTVDSPGQRLTPDRDSSADNKPPSPVPDGYHTPTFPLASYYYSLLNVPHVPYTGYTAVTIPAFQPPLPEKKRFSSTAGSLNGHNSLLRASSAPSPTHHVTFSPAVGEQRRGSSQSFKEDADIRVNAKFVQDSSKYWYKPGISRDQGKMCIFIVSKQCVLL